MANDNLTIKQMVVIGSPELAAFIEAREHCADDDLVFPYRGFVDFRSKVGHRPTPASVLMRVGGEPVEFAWV